MRKLNFLLLFLAVTMFAQAQIATDIYWVQFSDKDNSPYSIDNPEAYLSPRALQRRANLGIAIDEYDIPVNPQYLQAVADCGAELLNPSKWLNGVSVHVTDHAVIEAINALGFVEVVRNCPNDPKAQEMKERWMADEMKAVEGSRGFRGYYGGAEAQVTQLKVDVLHEQGYDGTGIVVAILDGGFVGTENHACFDNMREEGRLLGTRDFVYGSTSVYTQSTHGTSCLSTMAAYVPNQMVGTAPKASYYLLHTEDGPNENIVEEYNWVSGAEYADSLGVDVCSTSLGYIGFDMSQWDHPFEHFDGHTAPMTIGAEIAASRGMICMNAASNEEGGNTYVASGDGGWWPYYNGNGTSFATPVLAGAVACLRQARPYASVQEICDVIRSCGNRADNPDSKYGYGIPDFSQALELLHVEEAPIQNNNLINVYPNPSQGEMHVVLNEGAKAELTVFDFMGRQLYTYSFNGLNHTTLETYLNTLVSGVYFIKAVSELGNQTLKLVITK